MDRNRWKRWISYPTWPCPACSRGIFSLDSRTISRVQSRKEKFDQADPKHYHAELLERFVGIIRCSSCGETGTVAGNYCSHWLNDGTEDGYTDLSYEVLSIIPAPLPFNLINAVPKAVAQTLSEVGGLIWSDHKAAASRCREVVEAILTDRGVSTILKKGHPKRLHARIDDFKKLENGKWFEQAEMVEAVKWIGNDGTHAETDREAVLDALEMLEAVIDDIYVRGRHALLAKAKAKNLEKRTPLKASSGQP